VHFYIRTDWHLELLAADELLTLLAGDNGDETGYVDTPFSEAEKPASYRINKARQARQKVAVKRATKFKYQMISKLIALSILIAIR
jgi:hypothetical protein